MCGRVHIKHTLRELVAQFGFANSAEVEGLGNSLPRWNGAPRQKYPIIVAADAANGESGFIAAQWGLIPRWIKEASGGPQPINAKCETVKTNGLFRAAYQARRALMPIDGFFEWKDILGTGKNKQPYAIAMRSGEPFALAALWEEWMHPETGEVIRTFTVITCPPNEMVAEIHDRMPVIIAPADYHRWMFGEDPADLMRPFPAELMTMWKIGRAVGSPKNNTPDILDPLPPDLI
ncbi:SOS response-associated peptidase [Mesorhizobium australicum]|uniref:Abasic site processing protein n=1 Tax=Mesorhizobium australicum TaxID=536018 RepID=A0A1X7NWH2_9HYPH|nr:SOS response-associated peptidase [Mesorhizobium australicum]SMH42596.1 Putative SOS response-associated peptidase YedK [Mesorhizobium australicum]